MIIIGLTGSIGMGKTTVARQLAVLGAKICHADAIVHALMMRKDVAAKIEALFPKAVKEGRVDRKALGEIVFKDAAKRRALEALLHPLVEAEENRFMETMRRLGARAVVLDIPLLFETSGEKRCDLTLVATAPHFLQMKRVMQRPGMTEEKFRRIVAAQIPDLRKRLLAGAVISTGLGKAHSFRQIKRVMRSIHAA